MTANDAFEVTWEVEATVKLVQDLCEKYPIDRGRIYGTGQSMGCMMLCEMNLRYPDLFAGSYLVAGQWDLDRMAQAKEQNLWAIVAEKDEKAFPILGSCFDNMEANGAKVVRGHIDAKLPLEDRILEEMESEDTHLYFALYEGGSVLPEGAPDLGGMHHVNTWIHAYELETPKRWLFARKKADRILETGGGEKKMDRKKQEILKAAAAGDRDACASAAEAYLYGQFDGGAIMKRHTAGRKKRGPQNREERIRCWVFCISTDMEGLWTISRRNVI